MMLNELITHISDGIWGWPLLGLIIISSVYIIIRTHGTTLTLVVPAWRRWMSQVLDTQTGGVSDRVAAWLGIIGTSLGNGSLAGMATAVASGGPGALIWLWVFGIISLPLCFAENYISILTAPQGGSTSTRAGGPFAYIPLVPGGRFLSKIYAVCCLMTSFVAGCAMQANTIHDSIKAITTVPIWIIPTLLTIALAIVVWGGPQAVIRALCYVAPIKVLLFVVGIAGIIGAHIYVIPHVLTDAFLHACSLQAFGGACLGVSVMHTMRFTFSRAASASEVGLGTAGTFMATAPQGQPYWTALMSTATVSLSIFVVCTGTMLAILASGVSISGLTGAALTSAAFQTVYGPWGGVWVTVLSLLFGIGVMVGYAFIGLQGWRGLWGDRAPVALFYILYIAMVWWGSLAPTDIVWRAVDIANGGMLALNIYAVLYLMHKIDRRALRGQPMTDPYRVAAHTNHVGPGSWFVAIAGTREDGHQYISQACARGATGIVYQAGKPVTIPDGVMSVPVADPRAALSSLSARAYGYPANQLKIIGITGTKGKTSTTFLLEHMLAAMGKRVACISTVENRINGVRYPSELTTPSADYLHRFLYQCVQEQVEYVVMEVSAQAERMHRLDDIAFDVAVFMNFSQEHAEFYATQEEYFADKAAIMRRIKPTGTGIYSGNDTRIAALTHSATHPVDIFDELTVTSTGSLHAGLAIMYEGYTATIPTLLGACNAANIGYALTAARHLGFDMQTLLATLPTFAGVPGRLNRYVLPDNKVMLIDYAHNPHSIACALQALRPLTNHLVVVTGAGGDRDRTKRPEMARVCVTYADTTWLTTDNPRSEDPGAIIQDMCAGIAQEARSSVRVELDRAIAITRAYSEAPAGSCIVLMGKGPDEYQLIRGVKHPFSEREIIRSFIAQ